MRPNNQKNQLKNDRPDRKPGFGLNALMSAVRQTLGRESVPQSNAATIGASAVQFDTIEPRILLSGDVNPAALTISGEISAPGEQDKYEFTVEEQRRVVFDSLTNSNLSWKLDGPSGQVTNRTFAQTDSYYSSSAAFELAPGKYQITVDGAQDVLGAYSLRIIDADAAVAITPGVDVSNTLDSGNKTAVYRFSGTAGDKLYFDAQGASSSIYWRLIDPFGRQEGGQLPHQRR
jgi:hypothetical protein